jgi:hypothetical protein
LYHSLHAVKAIAPIITIAPPAHGRDTGQFARQSTTPASANITSAIMTSPKVQ